MTGSKITILVGAVVFLTLAMFALYRLLVGFPIVIGSLEIGQTSSFLAFVVFAALALMLFRSAITTR